MIELTIIVYQIYTIRMICDEISVIFRLVSFSRFRIRLAISAGIPSYRGSLYVIMKFRVGNWHRKKEIVSLLKVDLARQTIGSSIRLNRFSFSPKCKCYRD